jgi:hypothetical protein
MGASNLGATAHIGMMIAAGRPKDSNAERLASGQRGRGPVAVLMRQHGGQDDFHVSSIAAFKDQVEHDASTDPISDVSDWKVVLVLHLLLKNKEHRPASFDAFYDELVREAAKVLKMIAAQKDPEDWVQEALEAIEAGREVPELY